MICVENVKDTEPDYCDFIIQHLNPKSLRWLYYNRKSQENLDKLVNHFPLMTGLLLNTKRGIPFKPGQPRRKAINFDFLQKLPYLEQFAFSNQAKFNHYNALLASTFSKKLQKLSIEYFGPRPDYSFLYGKFTNLNFLRCLRISLRKDTLPFFALVVDSLPQLEELDISLLLYDQDNHLELMEKYLLMWSKFNKLNTLLLYIRANSFSLKRVFCIQCYLLLVLIFHYAHLIRIVVILFINGFRPFLIWLIWVLNSLKFLTMNWRIVSIFCQSYKKSMSGSINPILKNWKKIAYKDKLFSSVFKKYLKSIVDADNPFLKICSSSIITIVRLFPHVLLFNHL